MLRPVWADISVSCVSAVFACLFFMIYISLLGRKKSSPPLKLKGTLADYDTLDLVSAPHLITWCRDMTDGTGAPSSQAPEL